MEADTARTLRITLRMTEREARWLKNYMQNPMLNPGEYEGDDARTMRENFFCTLRDSMED